MNFDTVCLGHCYSPLTIVDHGWLGTYVVTVHEHVRIFTRVMIQVTGVGWS